MNPFDPNFYLSYYPDLRKKGIFTHRQALLHWQRFGQNEGRLGSLDSDVYRNQINLLENAKHALTEVTAPENQYQTINIISRTHNRPEQFSRLCTSIIQQEYPKIRHLVSVQTEQDYLYAIKNKVDKNNILRVKKSSSSSHFYNLFINELLEKVIDGWVIFLDDDDYFISPNSLKYLSQYFNDQSKIPVWQTWFPDKVIPIKQNPYFIQEGQITSCCFAFHISQLGDLKWDDKRAADYRFFKNLIKKNAPIFIPQILTKAPLVGDGMSKTSQSSCLFYYFRAKCKSATAIITKQFAPIPHWFNWKLYTKYPDLQKNGITTKVKAWQHWQKHGCKENRIFQSLEFMNLLDSENASPYFPNNNVILYVIDKGLEDGATGYTVKSHHTIQLLQKTGYTIIPVIKPKRNSEYSNYTHENIQYIQLQNDENFIQNSQQYFTHYAQELLKVCQQYKPIIIHACSDYRNGLVAASVAKKLSIKFVYEIRGLWEVTASAIDTTYVNSPFYQFSKQGEIQACTLADSVLVINSGLKKELISRNVDQTKIKVIPFEVFDNPNNFDYIKLNKKPFSHSSDDVIIGYFGNFSTLEGIPDLVKTLIELKKDGVKNFKCLLIGAGADFNKISELINDNQLQDTIILLSKIPYSEIRGYYDLIDLFCIPRRNSDVANMVLPMKLIEALSLNKPLLVSSVDAMTDVIKDGENGFVFEKDNYNDLYAKLKQILLNHSILNQLNFKTENNDLYCQFISKLYQTLQ